MSRLVGILLLCAVGCSSGAVAKLPSYPVTGTVKVGGKPLEGVSVQLVPVDEKSKAKPGIGKTDQEGKFSITTNGDRGANVGKFKVVLVTAAQLKEANASSSNYEEQQKERYANAEQVSGEYAKTKGSVKKAAEFPKEWASAKTSPKEVEIIDKAEIVDIDI